MVVHKCIISGYASRSNKPPGGHFYAFPNDSRRKDEWCDALQLHAPNPASARVCNKHFLRSSYKQSELLQRERMPAHTYKTGPGLLDTAVPLLAPQLIEIYQPKMLSEETSIGARSSSNTAQQPAHPGKLVEAGASTSIEMHRQSATLEAPALPARSLDASQSSSLHANSRSLPTYFPSVNRTSLKRPFIANPLITIPNLKLYCVPHQNISANFGTGPPSLCLYNRDGNNSATIAQQVQRGQPALQLWKVAAPSKSADSIDAAVSAPSLPQSTTECCTSSPKLAFSINDTAEGSGRQSPLTSTDELTARGRMESCPIFSPDRSNNFAPPISSTPHATEHARRIGTRLATGAIPRISLENKFDLSLDTSQDISANESAYSLYDPAGDDDEGSDSGDSDLDEDYFEENRDDLEIKMGDSEAPKAAIVNLACLDELFQRCQECGAKIRATHKTTTGATLTIYATCEASHTTVWRSHPYAETKRQSLGNVCIAAALYMSGITFAAAERFASSLKLLFFTRCSYNSLINKFVAPIIHKTWLDYRKKNLVAVKKQDQIRLAGDAQYDSPGLCATNCIYSVQDLSTGKIIDFYAIRRNILPGDMEKNAFTILFPRLVDELGGVYLFLSDRHTGVRKFMRIQFPFILHQFDPWHLSKSFMKKIKAVSKEGSTLYDWKPALNNHMWCCCARCGGDEVKLLKMWDSSLEHVVNSHANCRHAPLSAARSASTKWLHPASTAYKDLRKIMMDKRFRNDLSHASHFCHTGSLESYHNTRLIFCKKLYYYKIRGFITRSILAVFHFNCGAGREKKGPPEPHWSKAARTFILRNKYEAVDHVWRHELMDEMLEFANNPAKYGCDMEAVNSEFEKLFPHINSTKTIAKEEKRELKDMMMDRRNRFATR